MKALEAILVVCFATSLHSAPPRVIKATPENGSENVDSNLEEFRVVFDQPMQPGSLSVVGGGPTFPKFVGTHRWEDDRTFVWAWRLEPAHRYWLSINSERFRNFRSAAGESAAPYVISFRTAAGELKPRDRRAENAEAALRLQRAIHEDYSYHDLHGIDWPQRFGDSTNRLANAGTAAGFARMAAELLAPAMDIHLWLEADGKTVPTHQRRAAWNVNPGALPSRVERWARRSSTVSDGVFQDGIHYILIRGWPNRREELAPAFEALQAAGKSRAALIVDVRANGGGSENSAREFAGCFIDRPVVYARHATRAAGRLSEPQTRELQTNKLYPVFTNRVAVLTGLGTVSSAEAFVMMMKQNPRCTIVGERTAGASGNPRRIDLGNGVAVFVPSWRQLDLNGGLLETKGIEPDIAVRATQADFANGDPVLASALKHLRAAEPE